MSIKLGLDCKAYIAAAVLTGQTESDVNNASWTEIDNITDVNGDFASAEADITTRGGDGWRLTALTLKNATQTFKMIWDTGDAVFTQLKAAWLAGTEVALAFVDGDITTGGTQGFASNFYVSFSTAEPLEGAKTVDVTVKASSKPQWFVKTT